MRRTKRNLAIAALSAAVLSASAASASWSAPSLPKPPLVATIAAIPTEAMPIAPNELTLLSPLGVCRDGRTICASIINYGGTNGNAIGVDRYYYAGTPAYDRLLPPRWNSTTALYGWQHTEGMYVWKGACLKHLDKYGKPFMTTIGPKYLTTYPARLDYRLVGYNCAQA